MDYIEHPRVLELKIAFIHSSFVREFGVEQASGLFMKFCELGRVNWTIISSVINRKDAIFSLKYSNPELFRQQVIFMGAQFGEGRTVVAGKYLGVSKKTIYTHLTHEYDIAKFVNEEWLQKLDISVTTTGVKQYANEVARFILFLTSIERAIGNVSMAKLKL